MFIRLGAAVSVKIQNVQIRGNVYQFALRVPQHLLAKYGKQFIRQSLSTSDASVAARKAEELTRRYQAEFKVLTEGLKPTPENIEVAGRMLAERYAGDAEAFDLAVIQPAFAKKGMGSVDPSVEEPSISEYLQPHELYAAKLLSNPNAFLLSDALVVYLKAHLKGNEPLFITKVSRDWNLLIRLIGDIPFVDLNRDHARTVVSHLTSQGKKTGTIRRTLNGLRAITRAAITEKELIKTDPFSSIAIQGEHKDKTAPTIATPSQLKEIVATLLPETDSAPALITVIQTELGTRIGEVSGLGIDDIYLDADIPHVHFRERPWRTLKTRESTRKVPLVGVALDAVVAALKLPREGLGLFEQYAKPRGNDVASAAVNKRLQRWGMTSHDLRHTMKDRLREVGCPKDIRDAIQGHTSGDVADTYGEGHSLKTMQNWLSRIMVQMND
jgi:integrase